MWNLSVVGIINWSDYISNNWININSWICSSQHQKCHIDVDSMRLMTMENEGHDYQIQGYIMSVDQSTTCAC